jgi:hypothetical protein
MSGQKGRSGGYNRLPNIVKELQGTLRPATKPAKAPGFTDDGSFLKWDQSAPMARLQHRLLSNPGTTGATFITTGSSHYQALYVALLDGSAGLARLNAVERGRAVNRGVNRGIT